MSIIGDILEEHYEKMLEEKRVETGQLRAENVHLREALKEALRLYEEAADRHAPAPPSDETERIAELRKLSEET